MSGLRARWRSFRAVDDDSVHPAVALLSLACVIGLSVMFVLAAGSDRVRGPMSINGDFLGPEDGESVAGYAARADAALAGIDDELAHWALVSLAPPAEPEVVDRIAPGGSGIRVGRVLLGAAIAVELPEPPAGGSRAEVLRREATRAAVESGLDPAAPLPGVVGLVVHADAAALRAMRDRPGVAAVEPLPADAAYGRFGVRPLAEPAGSAPEGPGGDAAEPGPPGPPAGGAEPAPAPGAPAPAPAA
ncbi:hypothetical protein [Corynebacterium sphenisci]|uniref:hypothetical protein n=1 Tax=Corynebacterium sphenisci TaxID=191493 RepID=UPI000950CFC4|nr:hypothetical protein [Corynebacterium sphenisci]